MSLQISGEEKKERRKQRISRGISLGSVGSTSSRLSRPPVEVAAKISVAEAAREARAFRTALRGVPEATVAEETKGDASAAVVSPAPTVVETGSENSEASDRLQMFGRRRISRKVSRKSIPDAAKVATWTIDQPEADTSVVYEFDDACSTLGSHSAASASSSSPTMGSGREKSPTPVAEDQHLGQCMKISGSEKSPAALPETTVTAAATAPESAPAVEAATPSAAPPEEPAVESEVLDTAAPAPSLAAGVSMDVSIQVAAPLSESAAEAPLEEVVREASPAIEPAAARTTDVAEAEAAATVADTPDDNHPDDEE